MTSAVRSLKRRTLAVEVADTLREMILTGELAPDSRATQDELARMLDVSTMPVREGLLRLAAEGFVRSEPNRSFTIVRTSREDVRDIFWMHAMLAGELTARACAHADGPLVRVLRERAAECAQARGAGDTARMEAANWAFHEAINRAAAAPKLLVLLRATLRFIPSGFYALVREWGEASEAGHDAIVAAVEAGDAEAARAAAGQHVRAAGELLIEFFADKGYWTRPPARLTRAQ